MTRLVNFYTTPYDELREGDAMVCVVTLHVNHHHQGNGKPYFRMYRTGYPPEQHDDEGKGIPQGSRIYLNEDEIAKALFPVVIQAGMKGEG